MTTKGACEVDDPNESMISFSFAPLSIGTIFLYNNMQRSLFSLACVKTSILCGVEKEEEVEVEELEVDDGEEKGDVGDDVGEYMGTKPSIHTGRPRAETAGSNATMTTHEDRTHTSTSFLPRISGLAAVRMAAPTNSAGYPVK